MNRPGDPFVKLHIDTTSHIRPGDVGATYVTNIPMNRVPAADLDACAEYLDKWKVEHPFPIVIEAVANGHIVFMKLSANQPDASKPYGEVSLEIEIIVPTPRPTPESDRWVRALLRWFVCHELDEFITVDGKRIFDPHRDGRRPTPENS